jgi:hypothetical protein
MFKGLKARGWKLEARSWKFLAHGPWFMDLAKRSTPFGGWKLKGLFARGWKHEAGRVWFSWIF